MKILRVFEPCREGDCGDCSEQTVIHGKIHECTCDCHNGSGRACPHCGSVQCDCPDGVFYGREEVSDADF